MGLGPVGDVEAGRPAGGAGLRQGSRPAGGSYTGLWGALPIRQGGKSTRALSSIDLEQGKQRPALPLARETGTPCPWRTVFHGLKQEKALGWPWMDLLRERVEGGMSRRNEGGWEALVIQITKKMTEGNPRGEDGTPTMRDGGIGRFEGKSSDPGDRGGHGDAGWGRGGP